MNLKSRLRHLAEVSEKDRRLGRTSEIARIARENSGVVLAADFEQARNIQRAHGVTSKSVDVNLEGLMGPFFFDHHATERLLKRAADRIEELESERDELQAIVDAVKAAVK